MTSGVLKASLIAPVLGQMVLKVSIGWRRVIGCFIFIPHIPHTSPIIGVSFAKNDLHLKASYESSPPCSQSSRRGGGLGSRPKKIYFEYLGDGVEYHLMSRTPRR